MKREDKFSDMIFIIWLIVVVVFLLGIIAFYEPSCPECKTCKEVVGCWKYTTEGEWIAIKISNRTYGEMLEVCRHEIGHSVFARYCEDNIDKCMELTEENGFYPYEK